MAYTPRHYYRGKDDLDRGDPNKRVRGAELSDEFEAISSDLRKKEGEINDLIQNGGGSGGGIGGGGGGPVGWNDITGKPSTYPPSDHDHDYAPIDHDHAMDDLSDVNAGTPARDDFLVWNGSNWVATDLSIIETELRFKGGIDMTGQAPASPANGDLYVNNTAGVIDSSWGVISGVNVLEGKFVGYGADAGRWFLLGDMAQAGVSSVSPGIGIDVDDSMPSEPVVSIDRTEVDGWYADKNHTHDGDYLEDYTETDPVFSAHVSSGITQTDIDQWNAAASGTAPVVSVNGKTGAVALDHTDVGAAKDDHDHDLLYASISHSHSIDDLSDVNADSPTRDDLLIWNGSNWVANDFAFIETSLRFKGGIDMTGPAPANPENGDLYINDTAGVIDASWGVLAGTNVGEGKFVGWAEAESRWFLLGDMADVGVTEVSPGLGIDVDDSVPSEPVVSIDRTEVNTWYASYNHNHDGDYLKDYTETDPTVPDHVKGITEEDIAKWNTPSGGGKTYTGDNGITVDNTTDKISMSGSFVGTLTATEAFNCDSHTGIRFYRPDQCGIAFSQTAAIPTFGDGVSIDNLIDLGRSDRRWKNAHFSGQVNAGGDVVAFSDERLKDNVKTLDGSKVFEMRGVSFDKDGKAGSGVIAQELQKVAPELVSDDGEYLAVAYGNLVGYLIEAVKELKAEIEVLKRG